MDSFDYVGQSVNKGALRKNETNLNPWGVDKGTNFK